MEIRPSSKSPVTLSQDSHRASCKFLLVAFLLPKFSSFFLALGLLAPGMQLSYPGFQSVKWRVPRRPTSVPILTNFQYCTFINIFFIGNIFVAILRNFWAFHFFSVLIRDSFRWSYEIYNTLPLYRTDGENSHFVNKAGVWECCK